MGGTHPVIEFSNVKKNITGSIKGPDGITEDINIPFANPSTAYKCQACTEEGDYTVKFQHGDEAAAEKNFKVVKKVGGDDDKKDFAVKMPADVVVGTHPVIEFSNVKKNIT